MNAKEFDTALNDILSEATDWEEEKVALKQLFADTIAEFARIMGVK